MKVGIVGSGWGIVHLTAYKHAGVEVSALWVRSKEKAGYFKKKYPELTLITCDYKKFLNSNLFDFVVIATPPFMHYNMVLEAIKSKKHVLCEKPFTLTLDEAKKLLNLSKQEVYKNQVLMLGHELRFFETFQKMKKYIHEKKIGRVTNLLFDIKYPWSLKGKFSWIHQLKFGGGMIYNVCSHVIDLLTFLVGSKVKSICADYQTVIEKRKDKDGNIKISNVDDCADLLMRLDNKVKGNVSVNLVAKGMNRFNVYVHGTRGSLIFENNILKVVDVDNKVDETFKEKLDPKRGLGMLWTFATYLMGKEILNHFQNKKKKEKSKLLEVAASFEDGLYIQKVISACFESKKLNKWIDI